MVSDKKEEITLRRSFFPPVMWSRNNNYKKVVSILSPRNLCLPYWIQLFKRIAFHFRNGFPQLWISMQVPSIMISKVSVLL